MPFSRRIIASKAGRGFTRLAVVIPAHNESSTISRCLSSLRACEAIDYARDATIVVIADNCTDATADLARNAGATIIVRTDLSRQGKGFALQDGFESLLADGFDAFLVLDADTVVEPNFLREASAQLDSGADAVQARYLARNSHASFYSRLAGIGFRAINGLRPLARSRLGLSAGILGNGFGLPRDTLIAVPFTSSSIVEDLEYHLKLVRAGKRVAFTQRTTVRTDLPVARGAAVSQHSRWEGGRVRLLRNNAPALLSDLIDGKLEVFEPLLELLTFPLSFQLLLLATILIVGGVAARVYALIACTVVATHVAAALLKADGDLRDFAVLPAVPLYVLWRLLMALKIVKFSRSNAKWLRTPRAEARCEQ